MHLMVTNLILNLHVVVVESIVEVAHSMGYNEQGDYVGEYASCYKYDPRTLQV